MQIEQMWTIAVVVVVVAKVVAGQIRLVEHPQARREKVGVHIVEHPQVSEMLTSEPNQGQ